MQKLDNVVNFTLIQFLTIQEFSIFSSCSQSWHLKLQKYEEFKKPFFLLQMYSKWNEKHVKINRFHLKNELFQEFVTTKKIWKNQKLARVILQFNLPVCENFYIVAIPQMFQSCFDIQRQILSLAKYDSLLIEESMKSGDLSTIIPQHILMKNYLDTIDTHFDQLNFVLWVKFNE